MRKEALRGDGGQEGRGGQAPKGWERPFETLAREGRGARTGAGPSRLRKPLIEEGRRAKEAREKGDPLELLKANGWEWDDVVAHLTGQKRDPSKTPAPKVNDEIAQLRAEVSGDEGREAAGGPDGHHRQGHRDFGVPLREGVGDPQQVYAEPDAYHRQNGEPPVPGDFQASVALVLEAAETNLKSTAERFKKVIGLTSAPTSASVGGAAAKGDVESVERAVQQHSPTHSTAPPRHHPSREAPDPEEHRAAALQALVNGPKR